MIPLTSLERERDFLLVFKNLSSLAWQEVEGEDGVVRKVPMVPSWGAWCSST